MTRTAPDANSQSQSQTEAQTEATGETRAPISREILLDQPLPTVHSTQHVDVRRISIAPGHAGGPHVHNGPVFGNIETGSVVYQIDGEPARVLGPGHVFYEPEGARIARFDAGEQGVTFLGYFLLREGQTPRIDYPDR